MRIRVFLIVMLLAALAFAGFSTTLTAQQQFTTQDAIDLAASTPPFQDGLLLFPGWTAQAYNSHNAYGIWRVQFWSVNGEEIGWADVSPERGRMYYYEALFGASEEQRIAAELPLRDFVRTAPEVRDLMEDPSKHDMYVEYNPWLQGWGVYIDNGSDSLYVLVAFEGNTPDSVQNPRVVSITFPNLVSYNEWFEAARSQAVLIAYNQPEINIAVRDIAGWRGEAEISGGTENNLWLVTFLDTSDNLLATATVDLLTETVVEFTLP